MPNGTERIPIWNGRAPGATGNEAADRPALAVFPLPGASARPCVVVCAGGGYGHRASHEAEPVAVWLNGLGLSATVLEYRVSPYRYPWPLADARRAIRVVRSRAAAWSVDPCRIGILGFSAGGHVAAATAILADDPPDVKDDLAPQFSARPDLMVLCYPVISSGEFGHRGSMNNLLGPDPDPALLCRVSLERQVNAATPPAFVWHSTDDPAVPAENAIDLVAALRRHRVDVEFHLFARAGRHGIGLGEPGNAASAWTDLCAEWFRTRGWR